MDMTQSRDANHLAAKETIVNEAVLWKPRASSEQKYLLI